MSSPSVSDAAQLRQALSRVLQSRVFAKAQRSQRFLKYLVDAALADPPISIKEYSLAVDVFDRDQTYDPAVDATVRVEASRLRSRLREYYEEEGRDDPCRIEVPKGSYSVVCTLRVARGHSEEGSAGAAAVAKTASASAAGRERLLLSKVTWSWVGVSSLLVLLAALGIVWRHRHAASVPGASPGTVSLAILPIANHTGDASLNYIGDGLTDDLIRQLSQVPALRLIGHATVFRYRDRSADAEAIARTLKVDAVMTGELRGSQNHRELLIEITKTADGSVLLDRKYLADENDLPIAQADLQGDTVAKLGVESSALDPVRLLHSVTSNPEAYGEFLRGDELARSSAPPDLRQAIGHFEKAVALDPNFDLAWSALAGAHLFLGVYFDPPRVQMPIAREYSERALAINPSLGEAHGSLGLIHLLYDWNLPAAEAEMSAAGAEAAAIGTLTCTAHLIERTGKPRSAEEMLDRMLTYNPQSSALMAELGCVDFYRGNYGDALRHYRDALQADPQTPVAYWGIGKTLNAQGKHEEAIQVLRAFKLRNGFEPPIITAEIGYGQGASGHPQEALSALRTLSTVPSANYVDPYFVSIIYLSMNDRDAAFRWLNKALDVRSAFAISILSEPKWQPFQKDPRFAAAVKRMLTDKV